MPLPQNHSIQAVLKNAATRLQTQLTPNGAKLSEAKFEAHLLLQHVLGKNRAWLIAHASDALQPNVNAAFETLLQRRLAGEPVAYILGVCEFYGLKLTVTPDTLIPRPDTETLVEAALSKILLSEMSQKPSFRQKSKSSVFLQCRSTPLDSDFCRNDELKVLDLGTGSGAIALAIAKNRPHARVVAVDASLGALKIAQKNAQNLNLNNVEFAQSHWFKNLNHQTFDLIVSNPPYIAQNDTHLNQGDLRFEPLSALASGTDGLEDIRQIVTNCLAYLKPQGWLMLEHGYNQATEVQNLMAETGLSCIETIQDLGGNNRVTIGKNPLIISAHWL